MSDNDEFEHERCYQSQSSDSVSLSSEETETNHTGGGSDDSSITIAAAETKDVHQWKIVVIVVIAIVAGICGAGTYATTKFHEEDDFQIQVRRDGLNDEQCSWELFLSFFHHADMCILFCTIISSKTLLMKSLIYLD